MRIRFNDEPITCDDDVTVAALLESMNLHQPGAALAVNQTIIPREQWRQHRLREGDSLLLFQAIAGG
ncbi:sulfur carrier protein ThiS [Erwinia sp. CPCC 100877]|nr:sulfur carrier protein ThiS [Erwinia sp. CPCC 100877]